MINNTYSSETELKYGTPQGSVLAPPLFGIYIRSLGKYLEPSRFTPYGFADDHQLLKTFHPLFQIEALAGDIQKCFNLVSNWMKEFFLCLNPEKTKILVIIPPSIRNEITIKGTFINGKCVRFSHAAKNLGVILDDDLSFEPQITHVVQSCFIIIRNLSKIKSFLTYEDLRTAVSTYIFSKIDYCNSLYYGINKELVQKLQHVQNCAARLLRRKCGETNMSLHMFIRKCHWLPVKQRIVYKLCLIVHKCLHGIAPTTLKATLTYCQSSLTYKLIQKDYKRSFGNRSFARIAPKLWNALPLELRKEKTTDIFKKLLKTHLFDNAMEYHRKCEHT